MSTDLTPSSDITIQLIYNQIIPCTGSFINPFPNQLAINLAFDWSGLVAAETAVMSSSAAFEAAVDANGVPINPGSGNSNQSFTVPVSITPTQVQLNTNSQGTGGTITATVPLPAIPNTNPLAYAVVVNFQAVFGFNILQEVNSPWISLPYGIVLQNPSNANVALEMIVTAPDTYTVQPSITSVGTSVNVPQTNQGSIGTSVSPPVENTEPDGLGKRGTEVSVPISITGAGSTKSGGSTYLGAAVVVKLAFQGAVNR